ncbi:MAG TPA: hypothetical protein PLQ55_04570, partial [Bacilli bacterium]|nr:hypothetical protein [Bacilli bacterium]
DLPTPGIPEAFKVLVRELQGLAINVELRMKDGEILDLDKLAKEQDADIRRSRRSTVVRDEQEVFDPEETGVIYRTEERGGDE